MSKKLLEVEQAVVTLNGSQAVPYDKDFVLFEEFFENLNSGDAALVNFEEGRSVTLAVTADKKIALVTLDTLNFGQSNLLTRARVSGHDENGEMTFSANGEYALVVLGMGFGSPIIEIDDISVEIELVFENDHRVHLAYNENNRLCLVVEEESDNV